MDRELYIKTYYDTVLSGLDADSLIESLNCDKSIVYVTFESYNEFGHKEAIKLWFEENGYDCVSLIKERR